MSSAPVQSPGRRPAGRGRKAPSRRTWVLSLGTAAALVVALIVFVNAEQQTANQPAGVTSPSAIAEQNREDELVVKQDQAPHVVAVKRGVAGEGALHAAVLHYMKRQIALGSIDGPVMRSACTPLSGGTAARRAYRCSVVAANETYPFLGVVDAGSRQVTYCKRDYPPVPSMNIPVSRRCT